MAVALSARARGIFVPSPYYLNDFTLCQKPESDNTYAPDDDKALYFHLSENDQRVVLAFPAKNGCFVSVHFMKQLIKRNVDFNTIGQVYLFTSI